MLHRSSTAVFAVAAALAVMIGDAQAAGDAKYPNWKGQWDAINPRLFTPTTPQMSAMNFTIASKMPGAIEPVAPGFRKAANPSRICPAIEPNRQRFP